MIGWRLVVSRRTALQMAMDRVHEHNRRVWDDRARQRLAHTRTAACRELDDPLKAIDGRGWIGGSLKGRRVLCLAGGGGLQSVLYAAAGAEVTVADISPVMLEQDCLMAAERSLKVRTIETSMDDLSMLGDASFDMVTQPVSTCYVPDLLKVYREIARVLVVGGLYLSQHKQPASLQAGATPLPGGYVIIRGYYQKGPLPPLPGDFEHREKGTLEYVHRWEELVGSLCRCGFVIEDLQEPRHGESAAKSGTFRHRSQYLPPYVAIKARRIGKEASEMDRASIIIAP